MTEDRITDAELDEILADVKQMWEALGDVAMQVPAAREIVEPRRHLPQVIDMVFDQAKEAGEAKSGSVTTRRDVLNEVHQRLHDMKNLQRASAWPHVEGVARAEKMVWDLIQECQ